MADVWRCAKYSTLWQHCVIVSVHRKLRPPYARICGMPVSGNSRSLPKLPRLSSNTLINNMPPGNFNEVFVFRSYDYVRRGVISCSSTPSPTLFGSNIRGALFLSHRRPLCKKTSPTCRCFRLLNRTSHMIHTVALPACRAKNRPVEIGRVGFATPLKWNCGVMDECTLHLYLSRAPANTAPPNHPIAGNLPVCQW